jgi:hypothetical protein
MTPVGVMATLYVLALLLWAAYTAIHMRRMR